MAPEDVFLGENRDLSVSRELGVLATKLYGLYRLSLMLRDKSLLFCIEKMASIVLFLGWADIVIFEYNNYLKKVYTRLSIS